MKKRKDDGGSDGLDLTGINDAEINSYIRNKKETQFRTILWELLNQDYSDKKRGARTMNKKKKKTAADEALKIAGTDLKKKRKTKTTALAKSSKINYDALKNMMKEEDESSSNGLRNHDGDVTGDQFNGYNCEDDGCRYADDEIDFVF